ncbi:MAG: radical SAM protein [Bryobacteraceae bacterium]|nr:radical SAM protein [Bryobacteraceae bacterium]
MIEEISYCRSQWAAAPRYVSIALTNACDLSCSYCYAPKSGASLAADTVLRWASDLSTNGCLGIGFGGGEPTLYGGLVDLCAKIHTSTDLATTITTHGHRFTRALANELRGIVQFIRVSMDGVGSVYETLRGRSFASFAKQLALIRCTAPFGINFVLNSATAHQLAAAAEFAFKEGAKEFLILPEVDGYGVPQLESSVIQNARDWITAHEDFCRLASSDSGGVLFGVPTLPVCIPAEAYREFLHIDAFGYLRRSAFVTDGVLIASEPSIIAAIQHIPATDISLRSKPSEDLVRLRQ